jgi:hypothetical protein
MVRCECSWRWFAAIGLSLLLSPGVGQAQMHHQHPAPADTTTHHHPKESAATHQDMHSHMDMTGMNGMYGPYPMTREASGTSWQPDVARHKGVHIMRGEWMVMLHGFADLAYDRQGGDRGDTKTFSSNMGMAMAQRALGPGTLGLRSMLSLEPGTIGKEGYPLLLQTGETADGRTPLIDRQHPHDLFMELAASYSLTSGNRSLFLYGGLPGEPALGPPAFMHRFSGINIPVAPITHHWLDSTHITYGVLTAGAVVGRIKAEVSSFRGREPDQDRWNIESPELDSHSFRLSVNPTNHWALQVSYGHLDSPEQLDPEVDQDRTTASAMYDGTFGDTGHWQGMVAWGQNRNRPGHVLDAFSVEAAAAFADRHTVFARAERVGKDELFLEPDPRVGQVFDVGELTAGYRYDPWRREHLTVGIGAAAMFSQVPRELRDAYGDTPVSGVLFAHVALH